MGLPPVDLNGSMFPGSKPSTSSNQDLTPAAAAEARADGELDRLFL